MATGMSDFFFQRKISVEYPYIYVEAKDAAKLEGAAKVRLLLSSLSVQAKCIVLQEHPPELI